jgi:hypothetical protein
MTPKPTYIRLLLTLSDLAIGLLVLQNSKSAYMKCDAVGYEDKPSFKSFFTTLFNYESSIFGEIKVKKWNNENGWINFCEEKEGTQCLTRDGYASMEIATADDSEPKKSSSFYVDFYETSYAVFTGSGQNTDYECKLITNHPLLN